MSSLKLIIGNKKYSSWSMRPWLVLSHFGIPFEEIRIPLFQADSEERLKAYSPHGMVPVLHDGDLVVWESLAICEYIADKFPERHAWPQDRRARAIARAVSTEMHAGFVNLRTALTTNLKARYKWKDSGAAVARDIARIEAIWAQCRRDYGQHGPWLFGEFSIADAMFAPVATRLRTYDVPITTVSRDYVNSIYQLPAFKQWEAAAIAETEEIPQYELADRERI